MCYKEPATETPATLCLTATAGRQCILRHTHAKHAHQGTQPDSPPQPNLVHSTKPLECVKRQQAATHKNTGMPKSSLETSRHTRPCCAEYCCCCCFHRLPYVLGQAQQQHRAASTAAQRPPSKGRAWNCAGCMMRPTVIVEQQVGVLPHAHLPTHSHTHQEPSLASPPPNQQPNARDVKNTRALCSLALTDRRILPLIRSGLSLQSSCACACPAQCVCVIVRTQIRHRSKERVSNQQAEGCGDRHTPKGGALPACLPACRCPAEAAVQCSARHSGN